MFIRSLALVATLAGLTAFASPARADQLTWRGSVDDQATIRLTRNQVTASTNGKSISGSRHNLDGRLPSGPARVSLRNYRGRGSVYLLEQPNRDNGYSALVRIEDSQDDRGDYEFVLEWDRTIYGGNGDYRNEDGRYDQGNREDRYDRNDRPGNGGGGGRNGRGGNDDRNDRYGRPGNGGGWGSGGARQERGMMSWSGSVDDEVLLYIRGNDIVRRVSSNRVSVRNENYRFRGTLPRRGSDVQFMDREGRGRIELVQTPSASNGYIAVVRIKDAEQGRGQYRFTLTWGD